MHTTACRLTRYALGILLAASLTFSARAQVYDLSWHTIDGGGAMFTTAGIYELSGTIGQPDAGPFAQPMSGGPFELIGGFWPAVTGQPCPGDVDGDGIVGLTDLATLLVHFGLPSGATRSDGDLDGDGDVDLTDLATLLVNFGTPSGATLGMGDIDGDGDVDLEDLAGLLSVFGLNCP
jgi:hypothetical protein